MGNTGSTVTLSANQTIAGNLSVTSGTLNLGSYTADRSAAGGTLSLSNGATLQIGGTNTLPASYTTNTFGATSTTAYNGTTQTVDNQTYGNLSLPGGTKTLGGATTVAGDLTLSSGATLDVSASNYALNLAGDFTRSGTFTPRSGTVTFNGSAAQVLTGATTFYNLTIANTYGTPSDTYDVRSSAAVTVTNALAISDGQFRPATGSSFNDVTISSSGIFKPAASASISGSGDWTNSGTFTHNSGTVTFNGSAVQTIGGTAATAFAAVVVNAGATVDIGAGTLTASNSVINNGALRQTKPVNAGTTTFINIGAQYYGVEIAPGTNNLGSTTVTVYGNQACTGAVGQPVKRCYEIAPTTAAASSVKFYYTQAEMQSGQTFDSLNVWHYNGSTWDAITRGGDSGSCNSGALNCYVQGNSIAAYSPFQLKNSNPLAAPLETLVATATPAGAVIAWETTSELDALGYHVYRADAAAGTWTRLTGTLLPSQAPGSPVGYAYRWTDVTAQRGAAYRYRVVAVELNGAETPLAAVEVQMPAAWLWLPVIAGW